MRFLGFCVCVCLWATCSALDIKTLSLSERKEAKISLANGMEVFCVSDPGLAQSAVALSVGVGFLEDPENAQGLAHYVEHMLFLGTEKYQEESSYSTFINSHAGHCNAFTTHDATVYSFAIGHEHFAEAVDRFAQFFIAPLLNESALKRELNAIHQEFTMNQERDYTPIWNVALQGYARKNIFIGNKESLQNATKDQIVAWYRTHYSAPLMRLCVYSAEPLEALEAQLTDLFSHVAEGSYEHSAVDGPLFDEASLGTMVLIEPLRDVKELSLSWQLPERFIDFRNDAPNQVAHVLGHEGEGSLFSALKKKGFASALSANASRSMRAFSEFSLSIQLTEKGVQNVETVLEMCYGALSALRASSIPEYIFLERVQMASLAYEWQTRQNPYDMATHDAYKLLYEPLSSYPLEGLIPQSYDENEIAAVLLALDPHNAFATLAAPKRLLEPYIGTTSPLPEQKSPWFETPYWVQRLPQAQLTHLADIAPLDSFALPRPNPFIPLELFVLQRQKAQDLRPKPKALETASGTLYYAIDEQFFVPELAIGFQIQSPLIAEENPRAAVLTELYIATLQENLAPLRYEALLAGLHYSIEKAENGLHLRVFGYDSKIEDFVKELSSAISNFQCTESLFFTHKELLMASLDNERQTVAYEQAVDALSKLRNPSYFSPQERLTALRALSFDALQSFCTTWAKEAHMDALCYGSCTEEKAIALFECFASTLKAKPIAKLPSKKILTLPQEQGPFLISLPSEGLGGAALLYVEQGPFDFETRAAQQVLEKLIHQPFYEELRTKQQTGYVVTSQSDEKKRLLSSLFLVQSSTYPCRDLLCRFELFLETFLRTLPEYEASFDEVKNALKEHIAKEPQNLADMHAHLFLLAFDYDADFLWMKKRIAAFDSLTYEQFVSFAHESFSKEQRKKVALCIEGLLENENIRYNALDSIETLQKRSTYTTKEALYVPRAH